MSLHDDSDVRNDMTTVSRPFGQGSDRCEMLRTVQRATDEENSEVSDCRPTMILGSHHRCISFSGNLVSLINAARRMRNPRILTFCHCRHEWQVGLGDTTASVTWQFTGTRSRLPVARLSHLPVYKTYFNYGIKAADSTPSVILWSRYQSCRSQLRCLECYLLDCDHWTTASATGQALVWKTPDCGTGLSFSLNALHWFGGTIEKKRWNVLPADLTDSWSSIRDWRWAIFEVSSNLPFAHSSFRPFHPHPDTAFHRGISRFVLTPFYDAGSFTQTSITVPYYLKTHVEATGSCWLCTMPIRRNLEATKYLTVIALH